MVPLAARDGVDFQIQFRTLELDDGTLISSRGGGTAKTPPERRAQSSPHHLGCSACRGLLNNQAGSSLPQTVEGSRDCDAIG